MDKRIHLDVISWVLLHRFLGYMPYFLGYFLSFLVVPYLHLRIVETAFSLFRFHFSVCPSKLITKTHCNIPAGGADAAAVGAVAPVGDILKRCVEHKTARELQRRAQIEREPCR